MAKYTKPRLPKSKSPSKKEVKPKKKLPLYDQYFASIDMSHYGAIVVYADTPKEAYLKMVESLSKKKYVPHDKDIRIYGQNEGESQVALGRIKAYPVKVRVVADSIFGDSYFYLCEDGNVWLMSFKKQNPGTFIGPYDEFISDAKSNKISAKLRPGE